MTALFKIVETVAVDYKAEDGQHWSSEQDARNYNGERAMVRILGKKLMSDSGVYTIIRKIAREMPTDDVEKFVSILDDYLGRILPSMMALEGPFEFGTGRQIQTPDGDRFDNKHKAALHILETALEALWPEVSESARRAITNTSQMLDARKHPAHYAQTCTKWKFGHELRKFFSLTNCKGNPLQGYEQRFRDALVALIEKRRVRIAGVPRPPKRVPPQRATSKTGSQGAV